MTLSLRARLILGIALLLACGLLVADVAGVLLLRSYLVQRLDQQLLAPVGGPPREGPSDPCSAPAEGGAAEQQLPTTFVITALDTTGQIRCRLPSDLGPSDNVPDLRPLGPAGLAAAQSDGMIRTVPGTAGGAGWRIRVVPADAGATVIGVSQAEVQATVHRLEAVTAVTSLVILALAVSSGFILVRVGLRPLTAIEDTAEAIAGGDLSRRVDPAPPKTEVGRLAAALNTMLAQIEQAFHDRSESEARLRRFVADASHELRTPVATIRGHAELYRQGVATGPEEVALLLSRIEAESVRMGSLVEDLLLLARLDSARQLERVPVDVLSLAADAVVDARARQPGRPIVLQPRIAPPWADEPPVVDGDEARLRQVLANLLSNTLRHTPPAAPVEVQVGVITAEVVCRVVDHGPGLEPEVAARVFERFYRGDPGRVRDTGGTGLGLSIVAGLVDAHDGRVWHEPTPGGGSTFVVSLPLRPNSHSTVS
ncbi:sensor histidine kinase [Microlunatus antarcticus]|uniref:histidine kinase n=1 Tax=Microlunatus antarcticus TaxID=53388 RepID=A0A7W5P6K2_9ACTN|nr:two-component system OmpR family sensor kinase [Microlunatus antarcticus]